MKGNIPKSPSVIATQLRPQPSGNPLAEAMPGPMDPLMRNRRWMPSKAARAEVGSLGTALNAFTTLVIRPRRLQPACRATSNKAGALYH